MILYLGTEIYYRCRVTLGDDAALRRTIKKAVREHDELQAAGDGTCHIMTMHRGCPRFSEFSGGYMDEIRKEVDDEERQ